MAMRVEKEGAINDATRFVSQQLKPVLALHGSSTTKTEKEEARQTQGGRLVQCLRDQPQTTLSRSNEMKKQIPVWECPRCRYVMTAEEEIGDEEELLAEFERVGQTIAEDERDPAPGEIAQCFRCGKFAVIGEDLQLRMPTSDEQHAINASAHLTESQIVWASFTGARRNEQTTSGNVPNNSTERAQTGRKRGESIRANNVPTKDRFTITYDPDSYTVTVTKQIKVYENFDNALAAGHELLRYFRQTKPGREWLCNKVSYDILRRIGLVRINKSGIDAHSFQKGMAACVGQRQNAPNQ